jgi:hypothetical protein
MKKDIAALYLVLSLTLAFNSSAMAGNPWRDRLASLRQHCVNWILKRGNKFEPRVPEVMPEIAATSAPDFAGGSPEEVEPAAAPVLVMVDGYVSPPVRITGSEAPEGALVGPPPVGALLGTPEDVSLFSAAVEASLSELDTFMSRPLPIEFPLVMADEAQTVVSTYGDLMRVTPWFLVGGTRQIQGQRIGLGDFAPDQKDPVRRGRASAFAESISDSDKEALVSYLLNSHRNNPLKLVIELKRQVVKFANERPRANEEVAELLNVSRNMAAALDILLIRDPELAAWAGSRLMEGLVDGQDARYTGRVLVATGYAIARSELSPQAGEDYFLRIGDSGTDWHQSFLTYQNAPELIQALLDSYREGRQQAPESDEIMGGPIYDWIARAVLERRYDAAAQMARIFRNYLLDTGNPDLAEDFRLE